MRFEFAPTDSIVKPVSIGDDVITWANELFSVQAIQKTMSLHPIAALRTVLVALKIERAKMLNYLTLAQL